MKVFAVRDSKIDAFLSPFFMKTTGEALRGWQDVVNNSETAFCRHPNDFCLFQIAEYDELKGTFTNLTSPISLGLAVEFKAKPNEGGTPLLELTR